MDVSDKVFGQYNLIRLLGRGGMGEVYEVEHRVLKKRYALKLLRQDFAQRAESVRRFELEAEVMAKLEHPHIVRVDGFGETGGRLWLQMELLSGVEPDVITLGDYAEKQGGKIPVEEFRVILRQILEGLAFAHANGVVHRDLKPGNILLERDASGVLKVKVSDFGLALVIGEDFIRNQAQMSYSGSQTLSDERTISDSATMAPGSEGTSTRALLGTWVYMSPEQRRGEAADTRSDVYAVGVMCYRLLTGKELGRRAISEFGVSKSWDRFVDRALDQDATARQADGQELLREFLKLEKKSRLPAWLAAGALVIAAVVLGLKFFGAGLLPTADRAGKMVNITNQPAGLSVALNGNATFNVGASGELPLTYQWRVNGRNITGATDSSLRVNGAQTGAAGDYSVVVANGYNSVTSAAATLAVSSQPAASPGSPYPVAGQRWTNSLGMIFIPLAGSKLMLSGYETRVQDYNEFRKARNKPVDHPFFRQDKNHPAIDVNWTEAEAFCAWLTAKEHAAGQLGGSQVYRLPTRSEWCQAIPGYNPNNRFVWGDSFEQMTNGIGNVLKFAREGDHTLPVGSFKVNQFGFADLVGNAAEWLGDSDKMGDSRYIIGGAWDSEDDSDFLVTAPPQIPKNVSREDVGFRCLLDLDPKKPAN